MYNAASRPGMKSKATFGIKGLFCKKQEFVSFIQSINIIKKGVMSLSSVLICSVMNHKQIRRELHTCSRAVTFYIQKYKL